MKPSRSQASLKVAVALGQILWLRIPHMLLALRVGDRVSISWDLCRVPQGLLFIAMGRSVATFTSRVRR